MTEVVYGRARNKWNNGSYGLTLSYFHKEMDLYIDSKKLEKLFVEYFRLMVYILRSGVDIVSM